jgi:hypothetical protein
MIKGRGSFHIEDYEIRSPTDKTPVDRTETAREAEGRRRKRRRRLGPPAEVEALLEEEESSAVNPESMAARASYEQNNGQSEGRAPDADPAGGEIQASAVNSPGQTSTPGDAHVVAEPEQGTSPSRDTTDQPAVGSQSDDPADVGAHKPHG